MGIIKKMAGIDWKEFKANQKLTAFIEDLEEEEE